MSKSLRERLSAALPAAMKRRDRTAVSALRSALAAIANAEAAPTPMTSGRSLSIEHSPVGAGATEVARLDRSDEDVAGIVGHEIDERFAAAEEYDRIGRSDRAAELRAEAATLRAELCAADQVTDD